MLNSVKSGMVNLTLDERTKIKLDEYISTNRVIPISLFSKTSVVDGIETAITFLRNRGEGTVDVPASSECSSLQIKIKHDKDNTPVDNFILTKHRYPLNGETRPYTKGQWELGDIIINSDIIANPCMGWVCVESGAPGKWKQFGNIKSWHTQIEDLSYLPDASEKQLGRQVLLVSENSSESGLFYCSFVDGKYQWVQQNMQLGPESARPERPYNNWWYFNTTIGFPQWYDERLNDGNGGWRTIYDKDTYDEMWKLYTERVDELLSETKENVESQLDDNLKHVTAQLERNRDDVFNRLADNERDTTALLRNTENEVDERLSENEESVRTRLDDNETSVNTRLDENERRVQDLLSSNEKSVKDRIDSNEESVMSRLEENERNVSEQLAVSKEQSETIVANGKKYMDDLIEKSEEELTTLISETEVEMDEIIVRRSEEEFLKHTATLTKDMQDKYDYLFEQITENYNEYIQEPVDAYLSSHPLMINQRYNMLHATQCHSVGYDDRAERVYIVDELENGDVTEDTILPNTFLLTLEIDHPTANGNNYIELFGKRYLIVNVAGSPYIYLRADVIVSFIFSKDFDKCTLNSTVVNDEVVLRVDGIRYDKETSKLELMSGSQVVDDAIIELGPLEELVDTNSSAILELVEEVAELHDSLDEKVDDVSYDEEKQNLTVTKNGETKCIPLSSGGMLAHPEFEMNYDTGHLHGKFGNGVNFSIDKDGHLGVEVTFS